MSLTIVVRFQVAPFSVVFVRSIRNDVIANILLSSLTLFPASISSFHRINLGGQRRVAVLNEERSFQKIIDDRAEQRKCYRNLTANRPNTKRKTKSRSRERKEREKEKETKNTKATTAVGEKEVKRKKKEWYCRTEPSEIASFDLSSPLRTGLIAVNCILVTWFTCTPTDHPYTGRDPPMYLRWFDRYVVGFSVFVGPWALRHADNIDFSACFSPWSAAPLRPSSRFRFHCAADALSARYLADHRASLRRCSSATGEPPSSSAISVLFVFSF